MTKVACQKQSLYPYTFGESSFGEENVGEFTIATISYSEPEIWLGKILANDDRFAKSSKVFGT